MSQASAGGGTRAEMERTLVQRSMEDDSFRQRLLDDPKATVEQELGSRLPEGVEVRVVQESQQSIYLVLPFASPLVEGEELSIGSSRRLPVAGAPLWIGPAVPAVSAPTTASLAGPEVDMFRLSFSVAPRL
jgi:Nitrile hydratase, alpha chain